MQGEKQWVVEEATQNAGDEDFEEHILPHCNAEELESVLPHLLTQGLWQSVGKVLHGGVSVTQHRWSIDEASKTASINDFESYILPHCSEDQLDSVLSSLEGRGLFGTAESEGAGDSIVYHFLQEDLNRVQVNYVLAKRASSLQLAVDGQSALLCAVQNHQCPRKMVTECIKMGFSTHQQSLTPHTIDLARDIMAVLVSRTHSRTYSPSHIRSPFLLAVVYDLPVEANMLYESGSCSSQELFYLFTQLRDVVNPATEEGTQLKRRLTSYSGQKRYSRFVEHLELFLPSLREMATTPRSLLSTCRLVISHSLKVRGRRQRDVEKLPLSDKMKNYVMFTDVTDPDSSTYLYNALSEETNRRKQQFVDSDDSDDSDTEYCLG